MPPDYNPATVATPSPPRTKLKLLIILVVAMLLAWGGFALYQALTFHITKTDPKTTEVGNYSPYFRVYFNEPLSSSSLKYSASQDVVKTAAVSGKYVTFNLASDLVIGQKLTITIDRITSQKNHTLTKKSFSFTVKDIPVSSLSGDQQKSIMSHVDDYPYSVYSVPFDGFDELTNNGLSADQEQIIKQAIFDFSQQTKTKYSEVTLDTASISPGAFDPNGDSSTRTVNFNITANGTPYSIIVTYDGPDSATVVLHDQTGAVVYDNSVDNGDAIDSATE